MEVKKYEELNKNEEAGIYPADVRFTEIASEDGEIKIAEVASPTGNVEVVHIDSPTETDEKKKSAVPKKALIVVCLALVLLVGGIVLIKSSAGDAPKKNIVVTSKGQQGNGSSGNTAAVPGFNPDSASKDLTATTADAGNAATTLVVQPGQQQPPSANVPPGMRGNIPPMMPTAQNPIFGSTVPTGSQPVNGGNVSSMDVPVTQVGSAAGSPATASTTANKPAGGNSVFNSSSTNAPAASKSNYSGSRSSGTRADGGGGNANGSKTPDEIQPMASTPASQSSYFLFVKGAKRYDVDKPVRDDYPAQAVSGNKTSAAAVAVRDEYARPPFGTLLPLQTLGAIDTLGQTPLVRMVLTRTMVGNGWRLERGTVFVGRASGGRASRAYVSVIGYLDNRSNSFVRIGGDVQGVDGASGLKGEKKRIGSRWLKVLREISDKAYQSANAWITRNGSGTNITLPSPAQLELPNQTNSVEYVYVRPSTFGYFLVNDLPADASRSTAPLPSTDTTTVGGASGEFMSDEEMVNLMSEGDAEKIKLNLPRIRPEYREQVTNILKSKEQN